MIARTMEHLHLYLYFNKCWNHFGGLCTRKNLYVWSQCSLPYWQLTTKGFITQSYNPKTDSWQTCSSMQTGRYDLGNLTVDDLLYLIGGFTIQFSSSGFNPNPIDTFSAVNEQYTSLGYATIPLITVSLPQKLTEMTKIIN